MIVFHRGATEASDIKLSEVHLSDFSSDPQEGGSCLNECSAYVKPAAEIRGFIDHMSQTEIEITLTPPGADGQGDLLAPPKGRANKKAAAKAGDAPDQFEGSDLARKPRGRK